MKKFTKQLLILIITLAYSGIHSINYTWNGTFGNSWTNASNWTPIGVPGTFDNVTIVNAGLPPQVAGDVTITALTMSPGSSINIGSFIFTATGTSSITGATINGATGMMKFNGGVSSIVSSNVNSRIRVSATAYTITASSFLKRLYIVKAGATLSACTGNIYNDTLEVDNNGTGQLRFGSTTGETYNGKTIITNFSTGDICLAYNSTGNVFNGDIQINSLVMGGNLNFGIAGGTSTLSNGYTILEGGSGFLGGTLEIRNLTQLGTSVATHSIDLEYPTCCSGGNLILKLGPGNVFNGNVNFRASNLFLNGGTYNGPLSSVFEKCSNGHSSNNIGDGGNIFNSPDTWISNTTLSSLTMANNTPDDFNGNVHFVRGTTGAVINVAYNGINTFAKNIDVVVPGGFGVQAIQFGYGTGSVLLDGTTNQSITNTNTLNMPPPSITRLIINKPSGVVTTSASVSVLNALTLTFGNINSFPGRCLILGNGASTGLGSASSYVNGPMVYMYGNIAPGTLNFPIGKGVSYRPVILNTTHTNTTVASYTAEVINSSAMALSYTLPITLNLVSPTRYYLINREAVANLSSANVTLFYGPDDWVSDPANLRIAKTIGAGTVWNDVGGSGSAVGTGSITSISFNSFSTFALANNVGGLNPLPVELVEFKAKPSGKKVELTWKTAKETENSHFTVERSVDASSFEPVETIKAAGNSSSIKNYLTFDSEPYRGVSYYRLKQTNNDQSVFYSSIQSVNYSNAWEEILMYPNPVVSELNFNYNSKTATTVNLRMMDCTGKIVIDKPVEMTEGSNNIKINMDNIAKGIYFLQFGNDNPNYIKVTKN